MNRKQLGFYFLLFIVLALAAQLYVITAPFLPAIATGCVLAYIFNPFYNYLNRLLRNNVLAAVSVIVVYIALILVPVILIGISVEGQVQAYLNEDTVKNIQQAVNNLDESLSALTGLEISDQLISDQFPKLLSKGQDALTALGGKLIFGLTSFVLSVFITIFLLFYLLLESGTVIGTFRSYAPLSNEHFDALLEEMAGDTRSLILGQLIIALLQGTLAALGFFIFGVPGVILWGLVMTFLSFLPLLGSPIIWLPASVILLLRGEYFNGIGLMVWGFAVVGLVDNLIRPKLTSSMGSIHPVTVLVGVLVGVKEWGLIGMVLGPLLISVVLSLIRMFRKEYIDNNQTEANT